MNEFKGLQLCENYDQGIFFFCLFCNCVCPSLFPLVFAFQRKCPKIKQAFKIPSFMMSQRAVIPLSGETDNNRQQPIRWWVNLRASCTSCLFARKQLKNQLKQNHILQQAVNNRLNMPLVAFSIILTLKQTTKKTGKRNASGPLYEIPRNYNTFL